jgi:Cap4 dsDNA endonuclease
MSNSRTPENFLDKDDPGDETLRRFRYQAAYSAIKSLAMLEANPEVAYIFCEHWEDVLVKRCDGKFIGIQIKTRATGKDAFKSGDEEMLKSLKRFIHLEENFPNDFERYVIAANCGFWQGKKNSSNLNHLLELAQSIALEEISSNPHLLFLVKKLTASSKEHNFIGQVLRKVSLENSPGLEDINARLARTLGHCPHVNHLTVPSITKLADRLTDTVLKASSIPRMSLREEYLVLLKDLEQEKVNLSIQDKKITRDDLTNLFNAFQLESSSSPHTALLKTCEHPSLSELSKGMRRMDLKMIAGEISVGSISLAKDHKHSAEYLLNQWLFKYGDRKANDQYQQVRNIVLTECQEAYDEVFEVDTPFGMKMLQMFRKQMRERHNQDRNLFFGCTYEHLCGVAGILTEECLVWWSPEFELPSGEII